MKYKCDICQKSTEETEKLDYFGFTDWSGYCDKPECKLEAKKRDRQAKREDLEYCLSNGDFEGAFDVVGDGDILDIL